MGRSKSHRNDNNKSRNNSNRRNNRNRKGKNNRMAIVHVAFKSSSKAPPAAAHARYIARDGQYRKRGGLEIAESGNMPDFAQADPHVFWKAADAHERANGRTYTELQLALPRELDVAQRAQLAREATREFLGDRFAYTLAVHVPLAKDNIEQPHMHLMFSERAVSAETCGLAEDRFFKRNGARKDPAWNDRNKPEEIRLKWVEMMNAAMQNAGIEQRVDARSWADQGREDLAALREEKTLQGTGPEAKARLEEIEEKRRLRAELPALHLDREAAIQAIERETEEQIAEIERRGELEISLLDQLIAAAGQVATEVKERTVATARSFAKGVEQLSDRFERRREEQAGERREPKLDTQAAVRPPGDLEREPQGGKTHAAAEATAKVTEPARVTNAVLLRIAEHLERTEGKRGLIVSREQARIFYEAMRPETRKPMRLHGQGTSSGLLNHTEVSLRAGESRSQQYKALAHFEVSRGESGFKYVIRAVQGKVAELVAYLRDAAVRQLDWDTKVLQKREQLARAKERELPGRARRGREQGWER